MLLDQFLVRARLTPPHQRARLLTRPPVEERLGGAYDHRLTIVQAGAGYGKTTVLTSLARSGSLCFWLSLEEPDADPQQFLRYLIAAFRYRLDTLPETPDVLLDEIVAQAPAPGVLPFGRVVDALANAVASTLAAPALLVLDDYHFVSSSPVVAQLLGRLLAYLPPDLHVVISSRHAFDLPGLVTWRARGEVLELDSGDLAFTPAEIAALFSNSYAMQLSDPEVEMLAHRTEGWPIALQLAWQGMRGRRQDTARDLLAGGPLSHPALFEYLAHDVLERQPRAVQRFLRSTAVLRRLTPEACDAVTETGGGAAVLARLHEADLFLVDLGDGAYRYHHLFHDFLLQSAAGDPPALARCHTRAAAFFEQSGPLEDAIHHWLAAGEFRRAAEVIEKMGDAALRAGRLDTVASWVAALPVAVVEEHPLLLAFLGDIHRLRSQFDEALDWYASAERACRTRSDWAGASRALRGQALVYLDTVRPAQAESLLEEALRLVDRVDDRAARARLLELLAENKLNMGKPAEAEQLRLDAADLRFEGAGEDALSVRVKLRTGRLDEAASILEGWEEAERAAAQRGLPREPRSHRETLLILSLIRSFRGDPHGARRMAEDAVALGLQLDSPFITAVAQTRLGHATQLRPQPSDSMVAAPEPASPDESLRCYRQSIELGDRISVRRTRCEAMWGLTRAYGFFGDLASAEETAAEGAEIGRWAGDPWIVALIDLALGASRLLAGRSGDAVSPLQSALAGLRDCGDPFGRAAARLWLALAYLALDQHEHLYPCLADLLLLCETHGYEFLFTSPSFLGPPDRRRLVPLLLWAQAHSLHPAYAGRLLREMGLPLVKVHPGYQLRVQTLGAFRVWRGDEEVAQREWQRDKARHLFQLLLAQRNRWVQRDRLTETLWPELPPEAAARDFKVALNSLNRALEPLHAPDLPFAYVEREGSVYRLRPSADLWLDASAFEQRCDDGLAALASDGGEAGISILQDAIRLYCGDYLPDSLYEDWALEERERLLTLYLRASDSLAVALLERARFDEALGVCDAILSCDPCWERAYRHAMLAHDFLGNHSQACRIYQRCVDTLKNNLEVEPSSQTRELFERIRRM